MVAPILPMSWLAPAAGGEAPPPQDYLPLQGFGGNVTGGGANPSNVWEVTSTSDDPGTTGSFRWALAQANNAPAVNTKLIEVRVGGFTAANETLSLTTSNCTIRGGNAPSPFAVTAAPGSWNHTLFSLGGSNNLVEDMRFHRGTPGVTGDQGRTLLAGGSGPNAFRRCSIAMSSDSLCSITGTVTFSYCLFFWPLHRNMHQEGTGRQEHGYGLTCGTSTARSTQHCCVHAHEYARVLLRVGGGKHEFVSCVAYNWGWPKEGTAIAADTRTNYVKCVWMGGANTPLGSEPMALESPARTSGVPHIHISADSIWQKADYSQVTGWAMLPGGQGAEGSSTPLDIGVPVPCTAISPISDLWGHLKDRVGATLPARAALDAMVISHVDRAWAKQSPHLGRIIDCVFCNDDPNTHTNRDATIAPLEAYSGGSGWAEGL